ncbi:MAG TPA: hypothetical protein VIM76_09310 [Candidatus Dormibacteraeota bacterium]|jgi:hypothetical protein
MLWPTVVVFLFIALGCGIIEAVIGWWIAKRAGRKRRMALGERPVEQRQAVVYLQVAIAWHSYLRSVRTLVYPEEGPPTGSRDLASVLQARAQLQAVGSPGVQRLHDQVLETAVVLIDLLRSQTMSPQHGRTNIDAQRMSLRLAFTAISDRIGVLELQMLHEVGRLSMPREQEIEIAGRPVPPRATVPPAGLRRGDPGVSSTR